ncbi:MAG: PIN domain-containing protein [Actinomycetia bacterium]|nr:PIN domain-containing protein [Actinomycetes bacterium]
MTVDAGPVCCDTSVLVPALIQWHPAHEHCRAALKDVRAVAAHVLIETFSVLTRLPAPHRLSARNAADLLGALPFQPLGLPAAETMDLVASLGSGEIRGGAVYDALVARTVALASGVLLTRDKRAQTAYDTVGVAYRLLG